MRRVFWFSVGAAAGYYAARQGERVVEEARSRGVVGNVTLVASTAARVAASAARAAVAVGEAAGTRGRTTLEGQPPAPATTTSATTAGEARP